MNYRTGQVVEGKITGIQPYGAFVFLDHNTSGLIHISEISDGYVRDITDYVQVGETVEVKIIDYDAKMHQAKLSLKALHRTYARTRKKQNTGKAALPTMKIGFQSIAAEMDNWISDAEKTIIKDTRTE